MEEKDLEEERKRQQYRKELKNIEMELGLLRKNPKLYEERIKELKAQRDEIQGNRAKYLMGLENNEEETTRGGR